MTRTTGPLLVGATVSFISLSTPAHAHGLPPAVATFLLAFLALAPVTQTLADFFVIKRRLAGVRTGLAAILTNVAAFAVAIPLFVALQWLSGTVATALEPGLVRAAYGLRMLSPWPESLLTMAGITATKAGVLSWRFGTPASRRTLGLLFLSTLAATCLAAAIAALFAIAANE